MPCRTPTQTTLISTKRLTSYLSARKKRKREERRIESQLLVYWKSSVDLQTGRFIDGLSNRLNGHRSSSMIEIYERSDEKKKSAFFNQTKSSTNEILSGFFFSSSFQQNYKKTHIHIRQITTYPKKKVKSFVQIQRAEERRKRKEKNDDWKIIDPVVCTINIYWW